MHKRRTPEPEAERENAGETGARQIRSLRPLLALAPYIVRHPGTLVLAAVALVISALAMLSLPLAVRRIIDLGFSARDDAFIDHYFAFLLAIGVVLAIASSARFYLVNWLGERVVADLRADVFRHLARLSPGFYETTHSGEVMSRLTADTTQIKAAAGTAISQALRNAIMLFGALTMMLVTSPQLSLLVFATIPAIVLPLIASGRVVRRRSRAAQDTLADASAIAAENLAAVRTMQAFASESTVSAQYARAVEAAFAAARSRLKARAGLTAMTIFLVFASVGGVLWYGADAVVRGEMTGGRLSQFVLYAVFAAGALAELSEVWGEVSQAAGAAERLTELLATEPRVRSPDNPIPFPLPAMGRVAFRDVSFAYPNRKATSALDGVSFAVEPGETVALVGPSGAGKSTVFNLLLRFFDPHSGEIHVDGVPIDRVGLEPLRRRMALVPQDVALFAGSVADNIRYGSPDASLDDVIRAAKAAQADDFIRALPGAYHARLGERGVSLSGGQRQRIAVARAILRDAPILLLDEATSALDSDSEASLQRALDQVMRGRTTLVIAHRLATIQRADRILVFDKGRIVEQGTHAELLRRGGLYARLADLQFATEAAK